MWRPSRSRRVQSELLVFVHSPSPNARYLRGFDARAEAWTSLAEFEAVFAQSSVQNGVASKKLRRVAAASPPRLSDAPLFCLSQGSSGLTGPRTGTLDTSV